MFWIYEFDYDIKENRIVKGDNFVWFLFFFVILV